MLLRLNAQRLLLGPTQLAELEKVDGWNFEPHNIVLDASFGVQVVSQTMFDWAHCAVCDGIADVEMGLCFQTFHRLRAASSLTEFAGYVAGWTFPKKHGVLAHLFGHKKDANSIKKGSFTCTASGLLTLYPVLAKYFRDVCEPRGECLPQVQSMIACLDVLELLHHVCRGCVDPEALRLALKAHMRNFVFAYGEAKVRPKHHYAQHLPKHLIKHKALVACLTNERRHRVPKRYAMNRVNLHSWELGVLEEVTVHQLWELETGFIKTGMIRPHRPDKRLAFNLQDRFPTSGAFEVASSAQVDNGLCVCGDAVLFSHVGGVSSRRRVDIAGTSGRDQHRHCFVVGTVA